MDAKKELKLLEEIDEIPQPPLSKSVVIRNDEVQILEPLLSYIKKELPNIKFNDKDKIKHSKWNEIKNKIDLSGVFPIVEYKVI